MGVILIIDDDYQIRQSFEKLLTEEGHEVLTASSGETGLSVLRSVMPDLVLLDVRLPGNERSGDLHGLTGDRIQAPGDRHDRLWNHRDGH